MYILDKPAFDIANVLNTCVGAIEDTDLRTRLAAVQSGLEGCGPVYEAGATSAALHLVPRVTNLGKVTKDELRALYSDHFSAAKGVARDIYDAIKNAAPNKLCPLCSIGSVAHLDHHLPQSKYPDHAVLPLNLVPACHFCNDTKKARFPKLAGEQTFHPYYDRHLLKEQWVRAKIDRGPPPVVVFFADAPANWPAVDRARVERHFKVCGLGIPFATHANSRMSALRLRLTKLHARGGAAEIQAYLNEERETLKAKPNTWEHVFFQALANDPWFINGGFDSIA